MYSNMYRILVCCRAENLRLLWTVGRCRHSRIDQSLRLSSAPSIRALTQSNRLETRVPRNYPSSTTKSLDSPVVHTAANVLSNTENEELQNEDSIDGIVIADQGLPNTNNTHTDVVAMNVNSEHTIQISQYPHSAFEDDFLEGNVDDGYLDDLVLSVKARSDHELSNEEKLKRKQIQHATRTMHLPFDCLVNAFDQVDVNQGHQDKSRGLLLKNSDNKSKTLLLGIKAKLAVAFTKAENAGVAKTSNHDQVDVNQGHQDKLRGLLLKNLDNESETPLSDIETKLAMAFTKAENTGVAKTSNPLDTEKIRTNKSGENNGSVTSSDRNTTITQETNDAHHLVESTPELPMLFQFGQRDNELEEIRPFPPINSPSFSSYVNHSVMLQELVKMGVDLYKIQQDPELAYAVFHLNLERNVKPLLRFLDTLRIKDDDVTRVINSNPLILTEPLKDMETRIAYFASKRFKPAEVRHIIQEVPLLLTTPVKMTDKMLGFVFKEFKLSPKELRHIVSTYPQVFNVGPRKMLSVNRCLRDCCEFSPEDIRKMLVKAPSLLNARSDQMQHNFETLYDDLELEREQIMQYPAILKYSMAEIQRRVQLLKDLDRYQLNPKKENFVSMEMLCLRTEIFAEKVAKLPLDKFNSYYLIH